MLVVAALLLVSVAAAAIVAMANDGLERGHAQGIADVVALAAASDPDVAAALARRNGASLSSMRTAGETTIVVIRFGGCEAVAAARLVPAQ